MIAATLLLAAACSGDPVPTDELAIRIDCEPYEVPVATGFPLSVTRSWADGVTPEDWNDETLSPLVVRAEGVASDAAGGHVREVRRFTAFAAELGDVRVLPPLFVGTRADGAEITTTGEVLDLRVLPVLPEGDSSEVELPGGMLRPKRRWGLVLGGLAGLFLMALAVARVLRAPAQEERDDEVPPAPPAVPPEEIASERLVAAERLLGDHDPRPLHDVVSDALRGYVAARFGVGTPESTTREIVAGARRASMPGTDDLAALLARCDAVRFARAPADGKERARTIEQARALVRRAPRGGT